MKIIINQQQEIKDFKISNDFQIKKQHQAILFPEIQGSIKIAGKEAVELFEYLQSSTIGLIPFEIIQENESSNLFSFYASDIIFNPENDTLIIQKIYPQKELMEVINKMKIPFFPEINAVQIHLHDGLDNYPDEMIRDCFPISNFLNSFKVSFPFEVELAIPNSYLDWVLLSNHHLQKITNSNFQKVKIQDILTTLTMIYQRNIEIHFENNKVIISMDYFQEEQNIDLTDDDIISGTEKISPLPLFSAIQINENKEVFSYINQDQMEGIFEANFPFNIMNSTIYDLIQYPENINPKSIVIIQSDLIDDEYFSKQGSFGIFNPELKLMIENQKKYSDAIPGSYQETTSENDFTLNSYPNRNYMELGLVNIIDLKMGNIISLNSNTYQIISTEKNLLKPIQKIKAIQI